MNNTTEQALFCPECTSALVDFSVITGGTARCQACGWSGAQSEMMTTPFSHDMGSSEQVMVAFAGDLRNMFSQNFAIPFGRFLMKWGFLPEEPKQMGIVLARYVTAVARVAVRAVFEERAAMEKERVRDSAKTSSGDDHG